MVETVEKIVDMLGKGVSSLSLTERHDYSKHVPESPAFEARKRWYALGSRFRCAADKVVAAHGTK